MQKLIVFLYTSSKCKLTLESQYHQKYKMHFKMFSLLYVNGTSKTGTIDLESMGIIVKSY